MSDELLAKVKLFICGNKLLYPEAPVIVGLSGGADSVCLLSVLTSLGFECIAAHCNFHLRGEESERDFRHAEAVARDLGCKFKHIGFDVDKYRLSHPGKSVEMACRDLRYEWFMALKSEMNAQAIAVGHNADDNIETVLFNLQRGTGLRGLRGMLPHNDKGIVRPLLCISRLEIEAYLHDRKIRYITDSTNLESDYNRNKIRNKLLPFFEQMFPNVRKGITLSINRLSEDDSFIRQAIAEKQNLYKDANGAINLRLLTKNEPEARLLLYEWLSPIGFSRSQTDDMLKACEKSGALFQSKNTTLIINRGVIMPVRDIKISSDLNRFFSFEISPVESFSPNNDPLKAYFDEEVLNGEPLTCRYWQKGDRMKPFGMHGTKKISDLFNDQKVPVTDKNRIPILMKGDEILWVAGIRTSALYPVTSSTGRFVTVTYHKNN